MRFLLCILLLYTCLTGSGQAKAIDSLERILLKPGLDTHKVNACRILTGMVLRTDPSKAIAYGRQGIFMAKQLDFARGLGGCYVNLSAAYNAAFRLDSALLCLDTAVVLAKQLNDPNRLALIYLNRADTYRQLNNFSQCLKDCDTSLKYAELAGNNDRLARVYQTMGSVYFAQNKYEQSIPYSEKALALFQKNGNMAMAAIVLNNLGNVYKYTPDIQKAIGHFEAAIHIADSLGDLNNLSMYHGNLCDVYAKNGNYAKAEDHAGKAMQYATTQENELQMIRSWIAYGEIYLGQKKYEAAINAANRAYDLSQSQEYIDGQQVSADQLSEAYAASGDFKKAFQFSKISKELNDSIGRQRYNDDIAALQTTFKVEEKNREIQLLSKDAELRQAQLSRQRSLLFSAAALLLLLIGGVVLFVNRNRIRQRMKELELRNRIAADLHDEVGSSLSSIHVLSNIAQKKGDGQLGDTLVKISSNAHQTMERMSDIVWAIHPANDTLEQLIFKMKEFAADILEPLDIQYDFVVEDDLGRMGLDINQRRDLYLIFKEAVNNAAKYSGCRHVQISITREESSLVMKVSDDGSGFDTNAMRRGNGLQNMRQRAKQMGGSLLIDSSEKTGTTVVLSIRK
ncbi:MAG TPA: tetratricopeptide repeat protein [Flavisolibacter sp.]|nr:tetratricopeptide repeat protein [Flavisolibacter sp.]